MKSFIIAIFKILPLLLVYSLVAPLDSFAIGQERYIADRSSPGSFPIVQGNAAATIQVDAGDYAGVIRAAGDLQTDIARVTRVTPTLVPTGNHPGKNVIFIGTIGKSEVIDRLIREKKIDVSKIAGQWESFLIQVVPKPFPGVENALVIAGSDKRGTIYGIYDLSEQIGVSPWHYWADVPPTHHDELFVKAGIFVQGPPSVKYRGIFLNDEAPDLSNWILEKFGTVPTGTNPPVPPGVANYSRAFYTNLFELVLRLKGNYLWPAMWNNAFNEDDTNNPVLADEYGIVMGNSHQEPMLRAQKEWDRRFHATLGSWNYAKFPDVLENFWREGIRRNKAYESIVTMGLRGANDTEMAPGGPEANRALLEKIVDVQRTILREEVNPDITKVPQMWCLYKEVQEFYEHGMRAPDDVTLLWAEDNWGNIRRLPTAAERQRPGGAGIYYHFDYHGGPRSYQWLNTSPIPKIWEQMSLAKKYGADRIWIVNVGHLNGYEFPLEYFLDLAWDPARWTGENTGEFTRRWAAREFGPGHAGEIAGLMAKYSKYNGRRKPEMLAPDTYSLTDYREAEKVVSDYTAIMVEAEVISRVLPAAARDAFYQLVLFPVKAGALLNNIYFFAGRNALHAHQGRATAAGDARQVHGLFAQYLGLVADYDAHKNGKWEHFMDQPVLGYTTWRDPPANNLDHLKLVEPSPPEAAGLGVAIEGQADAVVGAAVLPPFDTFNRQQYFIDVFNRGRTPFDFTATASAPWIVLSDPHGPVTTRLMVSIDWDKAPAGAATGAVRISGAGAEVAVKVTALNPVEVTRDTLQGFVEGQGVVSIEPEHFTRQTMVGEKHWMRIADYGRTLSGMRAEAPVDAPSATPGQDAPCLEYRMYLFSSGPVEVTAITAPTLNFVPDRGVRYAVSFDDEAPQVITLVPPGYQAQNRNPAWEKSVADNAHHGRSQHAIASPGYHTLKVWMVDPAVVMQKLIVDLGGLKPSYLGPPESFRRVAPEGAGR